MRLLFCVLPAVALLACGRTAAVGLEEPARRQEISPAGIGVTSDASVATEPRRGAPSDLEPDAGHAAVRPELANVPQGLHVFANFDPSDDLVVAPPAPREACEAELTARGIKFRRASIPVHRQGKNKFSCGAEQMVTYLRGPEGIRYSAPPTMTCGLALAFSRLETIANEEAKRTFQKRIARIDHLGTYACREMAAYPGWVSEHSYANAIDLEKLVLEDGREISVLRHFEATESAPKKKEGVFLRTLAHRLYDEAVFSSVLTSYFDALHRNHFHLDLARYRTDGSRPCSEGGC